MNNRNKNSIFLSALLIITTLACGLENIQVVEPTNLEGTITAQALLLEQASHTATAEPVVIVVTATLDPTIPTSTVALTLEEAVVPAAVVQVTAPVGAVTVTVSAATNCRTGPGQNFSSVYGMPIGQVAEVVAKNTYSGYWIIKIPNGNGTTCWLWGQYATVTGNTASLSEVATPTSAATKKPINTLTLTPSNTVATATATKKATATITPSKTVAAPVIPNAPSGLQASISCTPFSQNTTRVNGNISWIDNSNNENLFIMNFNDNNELTTFLNKDTTNFDFSYEIENTELQTFVPGGQFKITLIACKNWQDCSPEVSIQQSATNCP